MSFDNNSRLLGVSSFSVKDSGFRNLIVQASSKGSLFFGYMLMLSSSSSVSSRTLFPLALIDENDSKEQLASFHKALSEQNCQVAKYEQFLHTVVSR